VGRREHGNVIRNHMKGARNIKKRIWSISFFVFCILLMGFLIFKQSEMATNIEQLNNKIENQNRTELALNQTIDNLKQENQILLSQINTDFSDYTSKIDELQQENSRLNNIVASNLSILFGDDHNIRIDPLINKQMQELVENYFEAIEKSDYQKLTTTLDPNLVENQGYLGLWEQRKEIEAILLVDRDLEQRSNTIKEEFSIRTSVDLVTVYFLNRSKSIGNINIIATETAAGWKIFRFD